MPTPTASSTTTLANVLADLSESESSNGPAFDLFGVEHGGGFGVDDNRATGSLLESFKRRENSLLSDWGRRFLASTNQPPVTRASSFLRNMDSAPRAGLPLALTLQRGDTKLTLSTEISPRRETALAALFGALAGAAIAYYATRER